MVAIGMYSTRPIAVCNWGVAVARVTVLVSLGSVGLAFGLGPIGRWREVLSGPVWSLGVIRSLCYRSKGVFSLMALLHKVRHG